MNITRGQDKDYATQFYNQWQEFHSKDIFDKKIETEFYDDVIDMMHLEQDSKPQLARFSPSGASKCSRELYYKNVGYKAEKTKLNPFHRRWLRNSTATHQMVQKDLMYMEKYLPSANFTLMRNMEGLPMWEENIKDFVVAEHGGQEFAVSGMMDGTLSHTDGTAFGFEFKTKSNSVAQVGNYSMKGITESHRLQVIAYSLIFDIDDYIVMYETVAKDKWMKFDDARDDIRIFHYHVTEEDKQMLLDKFSLVTECVDNKTLPAKDTDKCLFCQFKDRCRQEVE